MNESTANHELLLTGLREDNPRDFLAALGLLRLVDLLWSEVEPSLAWRAGTHVPFLSSRTPLNEDWTDVIVKELKALVADPQKPLAHGDVIKTAYASFRYAVRNSLRFTESGSPLAVLPQMMYAGYSSQLEGEGGEVDVSGFSFSNGQGGKRLLLDVAQLIGKLDGHELFKSIRGEATPVAAKSLRWNPTEFRPAAYRSHDPGSKLKGDETRDFPALNVLAFFGLTFFPTVPTERGGRTVGFHREGREQFFQWPIWTAPVCSSEISTLVGARPSEWTGERGVESIWRSRRFSSDKSLYFAPAEAVR
jgi:hypothetical protein